MTAGRFSVSLVAAAGLLWPSPSDAQTWVGSRTTPTLNEVIAIDETGEDPWPWGREDIEGDGLGQFQPPEQSLDIRTAYAVTDAQRFWLRVYVSNPNTIGGNVTVFAFIDSDENAATGGGADATDIDAALTTDTSPGGYEHVIGIRGNGSIEVWDWQDPPGAYQPAGLTPPQSDAESGADDDPIRQNELGHGYAQVSIDLDVVELTPACNANIFVRSVNGSASTDASDFDVGEAAGCTPADANANDVPDVIEPAGCTSDDECPAGGICVDGVCVIAPPCATDADCDPDFECNAQGWCVARRQGNCSTNADCNGLYCDNGECAPCTADGNCDTGQTCAPDGQCIDGAPYDPGPAAAADGGVDDPADLVDDGEEVQGGACTCGLARSSTTGTSAIALFALALASLGSRRRRNRKKREAA